MPRRRFRDPDPQVRDRNKWDASGQPAIGGLSRIGGAGRGGTSTIVARGGGQPGQVRIEHITLYAEASQTIASGGAGVSWDRIGTAPTELRGFDTCADTIGSTGAVVAIPVPLTGPMLIAPRIHFTDEVTGTATWVRTRRGQEAEMVTRTGTGDRIFGSVHLPSLEVGDTITLRLDVSSVTSGDLWGSADVTWGDPDVLWGSGAVVIEWGLVQCTQWELAATTTPLGLYRQVVWDDGPIAYWRLDETSGTTADDEMGSYDGTYVGSPSLSSNPVMVDGSRNRSADFDGVDDKVTVGNADLSFPGTASFSFECWVNPDATTGHVVGTLSGVAAAFATEGWGLLLNSGTPTFQRRDRSDPAAVDAATGGTVSVGATSHIAGTYDGTTMRLYVDGTEVASAASTRVIPSLTTFRIGAKHEDGGTDGFWCNGRIDEVAVYDRVLTAAEVAEHHAVGTQGA